VRPSGRYLGVPLRWQSPLHGHGAPDRRSQCRLSVQEAGEGERGVAAGARGPYGVAILRRLALGTTVGLIVHPDDPAKNSCAGVRSLASPAKPSSATPAVSGRTVTERVWGASVSRHHSTHLGRMTLTIEQLFPIIRTDVRASRIPRTTSHYPDPADRWPRGAARAAPAGEAAGADRTDRCGHDAGRAGHLRVGGAFSRGPAGADPVVDRESALSPERSPSRNQRYRSGQLAAWCRDHPWRAACATAGLRGIWASRRGGAGDSFRWGART